MKVLFILSLVAGVAVSEYCTPVSTDVAPVCHNIVQCSGGMIPTCDHNMCTCIDKPQPKECVIVADCFKYFLIHHCGNHHQECQNNHCVCLNHHGR